MAPLLRPWRGFRAPAGEVEALPGLNRMYPRCRALAALCLQNGLAASGLYCEKLRFAVLVHGLYNSCATDTSIKTFCPEGEV